MESVTGDSALGETDDRARKNEEHSTSTVHVVLREWPVQAPESSLCEIQMDERNPAVFSDLQAALRASSRLTDSEQMLRAYATWTSPHGAVLQLDVQDGTPSFWAIVELFEQEEWKGTRRPLYLWYEVTRSHVAIALPSPYCSDETAAATGDRAEPVLREVKASNEQKREKKEEVAAVAAPVSDSGKSWRGVCRSFVAQGACRFAGNCTLSHIAPSWWKCPNCQREGHRERDCSEACRFASACCRKACNLVHPSE